MAVHTGKPILACSKVGHITATDLEVLMIIAAATTNDKNGDGSRLNY